jgi:outer membrane protein assembly factor BamB
MGGTFVRRWRVVIVVAALLGAGGVVPAVAATTPAAVRCSSQDWSEYGANPGLSFEVPRGCSGITTSDVATLVPKWFFHATDSMTASPTVVGTTLYIGSWDGTFYALDTATGQPRWTYQIQAEDPTAFGQIVSSADVASFPDPSTGHRRSVVVFGGGSSIWALDAATGKLLARVDLDPRTAALKAKQAANPPVVEVESSPVVANVAIGGKTEQVIYTGMDVHNEPGVGPAGVVAMTLHGSTKGTWSFTVLWKHDPETDRVYTGPGALTAGSGTDFGCGDVWSSPAFDPVTNEVLFGTGDCENVDEARAAGHNWSEAMEAVKADTGALIWRFAPAALFPTVAEQDAQANADQDFGASPNIMVLPDGERVDGEGSKSAFYWVRNERTGAPVWGTKSGSTGFVQDGFAVGGYIGSTAVETNAAGRAEEIIGGTAIPVPADTADAEGATEAVHAFDAQTGKVDWTYSLGGPTYAPTTIVNGVALVPDTVPSDLVAIDASTGLPLWVSPVLGPPSSGATVVGDSVYVGTGTRETDLEYKAFGLKVQKSFTDTLGESPLSPVSGVEAWELAG